MPDKDRRPAFTPLLMVAFGLLLMAASLVWFIRTTQKSAASPLKPESGSMPTVSAAIPYSEVQRIRAEEAKTAFDSGEAIFVDTRGDLYFDQGHIPGAIVITEDDLPSHLSELDPNAWIITYCT